MSLETAETPDVAARLLAGEGAGFRSIGALFAERKSRVITTAARGSSDHAATFFKYLFEIMAGIPVASIGPSVASIYNARLSLDGVIHLTVSQSGASPDIIALQRAAKAGGALTVALVNVPDSPLAREADRVIALHAGPERSVAATKSCLAAMIALAGLTGAMSGRRDLASALARLPNALKDSLAPPETPVVTRLATARSLFIAGRGTGYAIALEAALKAKETCGLHAEAFSLAELIHGPMRLVEPGFPVLVFTQADETASNSKSTITRLAQLGADIITIGPADGATRPTIETPTTGCGLLDPLCGLAAFYRLIEAVSRARGLDPDQPRHLSKVTVTL